MSPITSILTLSRRVRVALAEMIGGVPVDRAGVPIPGDARRPVLPPVPSALIHREAPIPVSPEWDVAAIRSIVREHEAGLLTRSAMLAEVMDRSPRIQSALNTRCLGVLGLPCVVEPALSDDEDASLASELAATWEAALPEVCPEETLGELLRWAVMLGVAVAEVIWEQDRSGAWVPRLRPWHPMHIYWRWDLRQYTVITQEGVVPILPGDGKWVVLTYARTRSWMRGAVRCLGLEDAVRTYAVRDWARYSEKHGFPVIGLKVPLGSSETAETRDMVDEVMSLGSEGLIVLPQSERQGASYDATLIEPRDTAWQAFERLIERCDADVSLAILGQNLTSEVTGGSFAAAQVHDRVRTDYLEADSALIASALRAQLAVPWAQFNYGRPELAPTARWDASPPSDRGDEASSLGAAGDALARWQAAGADVDVEAFARQFGVPLREGQREPKRAQVYAYHLQFGILTVNEARALALGLPPIPGGDVPPSTAPPAEETTDEASQDSAVPAETLARNPSDQDAQDMPDPDGDAADSFGRYDDIDFTPTEEMSKNAASALRVRAQKPPSQRGMTAVGIARARDIAARRRLSPETVRRMLSFFQRHEGDKQGATWSEQGKGWQAWQGWGGDEGFTWAKARVHQMDTEDDRRP